MKYFEITDAQGEDQQFTSIRALRAHLKEHPEIPSAWRYWWCGDDLVECEKIPREEIFRGRARELKAGMTAQWAAAHGRLR